MTETRWPRRLLNQLLDKLLGNRLQDWERTSAIAVGLLTLTAALLTYWAVIQDDASAGARGQATLETLQLERQELVGAVRVQAEAAAADRYRRWHAEADALERQARDEQQSGREARSAQLRAEASEDRYLAEGYRFASFDSTRMSGTTATSTYDTSGRLATVQGYFAYENVQPGQPARTARVADRLHDQSSRTLLCVVLLLVLVIVLTVGRILQPRWRPVVLAVATAGYGVAVVGAVLNGLAG